MTNPMSIDLDNPLLSTATLVLETWDIDCDGTSYAFHRVTVPAWVAIPVKNAQNVYHDERETAAEANALMLRLVREGDFDGAEKARDQYDRAHRFASRYGSEFRGALKVLDEYLQASEQWSGYSMSDGYKLLTSAEVIEFEQDLRDDEEDTFSWEHWQERGYYSTGVR